MAANELKTRVTTPVARLSYPALFRYAEVMNEGDVPKYQCELIFPKSTDISELKEAVQNAIKNKFGNKAPANLRLPFRDGSERTDDSGNVRDGYDNSVFICPRSTDKPGVVIGRNKEPVVNESDVYGGCYVRVSVTAYYYEKGKMSKGIAFALNHVWKLRDGEPFASRISAEDDFEGVDVDDSEFDEDAYYDENDGGSASGNGGGHALI